MGSMFRRRQDLLRDNSVDHFMLRGGLVQKHLAAGAAAGALIPVPGILPSTQPPVNGPGDVLVEVLFQAVAGAVFQDLTSEFVISSVAGNINNPAGTDTTGGQLLITWEDRTR